MSQKNHSVQIAVVDLTGNVQDSLNSLTDPPTIGPSKELRHAVNRRRAFEDLRIQRCRDLEDVMVKNIIKENGCIKMELESNRQENQYLTRQLEEKKRELEEVIEKRDDKRVEQGELVRQLEETMDELETTRIDLEDTGIELNYTKEIAKNLKQKVEEIERELDLRSIRGMGKCPVCQKLKLLDAIYSVCGHAFCWKCTEKWSREKGYECPGCRAWGDIMRVYYL